MVLQIEALLLLVVVGEHVLALAVRMVAAPVLVLVIVDGGRDGARVRRAAVRSVGRIAVAIAAIVVVRLGLRPRAAIARVSYPVAGRSGEPEEALTSTCSGAGRSASATAAGFSRLSIGHAASLLLAAPKGPPPPWSMSMLRVPEAACARASSHGELVRTLDDPQAEPGE